MSLQDTLTRLGDCMEKLTTQRENDAQSLKTALNNLEKRMGRLEGQMKSLGMSDNQYMEDISNSLDGIDKKLGSIDQKIGSIDKKLGSVDKKLDKLDDITTILYEIKDAVVNKRQKRPMRKRIRTKSLC